METIDHIIFGFTVALTYENLIYCLIGTILGTAIGVLPGLGPTATIALLLPITFSLPAPSSITMLAGLSYGAQSAGSTPSILVNLPCASSSAVTSHPDHQPAPHVRA